MACCLQSCMFLIMLVVPTVVLMVHQAVPTVLLASKHIHAASEHIHVADSAVSSCCFVMQVHVCLCRARGHHSMQLLPLKPPEERWACSALFSCAVQLHTHQQFGAAITLFTAAYDAAASGLVRQAKDDTQSVQACTLSHPSVNTHFSCIKHFCIKYCIKCVPYVLVTNSMPFCSTVSHG